MTWYGRLVPLLIPLEVEFPGLGGAPCTIRLGFIFGRLLVPLMWIYQEDWNFRYVVDIVDNDRMYFTIFKFILQFNCYPPPLIFIINTYPLTNLFLMGISGTTK